MLTAGMVSGIATAVLLVAFIALCVWAFRPGQKQRWDESAQLPFLGDDPAPPRAPRGDGEAGHE